MRLWAAAQATRGDTALTGPIVFSIDCDLGNTTRSVRRFILAAMIVELAAETERKLRLLAQQRGLEPAQMVREWIEDELGDWIVDTSPPLVEAERPVA